MLEYVGITIVVAGVIVALALTTVPSDIQAGFANGVCRIVNPDDPDCKDGGATASPEPGGSGDPTSAPPTDTPTGDPTTGPSGDPGGGDDVSKAQEEADAAAKELEDAEKEWGNLDKELLDLVADLVGWNSAKDCFTKGDIGACLETLLTAIPWGKLLKAAKLVPKIWKLFNRWRKLRKRLDDAKDAKKKADKKLEDAKKKDPLACPVGNSFVPGTRVLMAGGGTKPIEDVRPGERVLATDPTTGRIGAHPVNALITGYGTKRLVDITVDADGRPGGAVATITATDGHPFWTPDDRRWTTADDLSAGLRLQDRTGRTTTIAAVRERVETRRVYNLSVTGPHTYHVRAGVTDVLVHNAGPCGNFSSPQNAFKHWKKHKKEFPELNNAADYLKAARQFTSKPPSGSLMRIRPNGDRVIFNPRTNDFAVRTKDGVIRTYFRPDPAKHGYRNNLEYFRAQAQ